MDSQLIGSEPVRLPVPSHRANVPMTHDTRFEMITSIDRNSDIMTWKMVRKVKKLGPHKDVSIASDELRHCHNSSSNVTDHSSQSQYRDDSSVQQSLEQSNNTQMSCEEDDESRTLSFLKPNFPIKLYRLLLVESPADIQWLPDGRTFVIHDINHFVKTILPKHFKGWYLPICMLNALKLNSHVL